MERDIIFTGINNLKDKESLGVKKKIEKIADLATNVLIFGETGVGKDFWVYYLSEFSHFNNILNLHCGDVPETLLESEWFGYRRGAFTGASRNYEGKWKQAGEGILFLNQIDLLSLNLQSRLLRIIERKKYFPLGSNRETDIPARF
ncbi:MAG: sigma 54-interacting transcriptional regulator, partial [Candidatus Aminicenantes bacterium]|nr:sigma 54-interacting transcriptional regulator [Candidatus Aminicenantes bacterium]